MSNAVVNFSEGSPYLRVSSRTSGRTSYIEIDDLTDTVYLSPDVVVKAFLIVCKNNMEEGCLDREKANTIKEYLRANE